MVQFYSEYNEAQYRHEKALMEAKASDPEARAAKRRSISEELADEGIESIERYEKQTDNMRIECLIDVDARSYRRQIARNARNILNSRQQS